MHERWSLALDGKDVEDLPLSELHELVAAGVPLKHRLVLWSGWTAGSGAAGLDAHEELSDGVSGKIELDVPRTCPDLFTDAQRDSLRRILRAHAASNPHAGYCQGINFIAAVFLLVGFDDSTAYTAMTHLLQSVCPGYHDSSLEGFRRDALVLQCLVDKVLPDVSGALKKQNVPVDILAIDHFIALTARTWPLAATVRLWDLLFLHGQRMLFASFLALLQLYFPVEPVASHRHPLESFKRSVETAVRNDFSTVLQHCHEMVDKVPQALIDGLRAEVCPPTWVAATAVA